MELLAVLIKYLETHKRLVVPQLGAFLVKEPGGSIVFSELMKRDDGVLRDLLCAGGRSDVEAAGLIDRFVFEVRHTVETGSEYRLDGFGTMKSGPNGTIVFVYGPAVGRVSNDIAADSCTGLSPQKSPYGDVPARPVSPHLPASSVSKQLDAARAASTFSAPPRVTSDPIADRPEASNSSAADKIQAKPMAGAIPDSGAVPKRTIAQPFPQPTSRRVPSETDPSYKSHIDTARMAETVRTAFGNEPNDGVVPPKKGGAALSPYEPLYEETDEDYIEHPTRRKFDRFLLVAILAVVIAVAAIAFGFWREARERQAEEEMLQMEQLDTRFE